MTATVLHAGFHKTGTTTLQEFLARHRDWLAERGVSYPRLGDGPWGGQHQFACWLSAPRAASGPHDLFLPEREMFAEGSTDRSLPAEQFSRALATDHPVRLLSSEVFCTFDAPERAALKTFVDPIDRMVLYTRNGIRFIYSCWAAKVRWGDTRSFDVFLRRTLEREPGTPIIGPFRFIEAAADWIGLARLSVRSVDAALRHPRGLIGDFIESELGLDETGALPVDRKFNVSPSPGLIEVLRALTLFVGPANIERMRACHARLYEQVARPEGSSVIDELSEALAPRMKTITIGELRPADIAADGSPDWAGAPVARLVDHWKFPLDEAVPWAETDGLVQAVDKLPAFRQLAGEAA